MIISNPAMYSLGFLYMAPDNTKIKSTVVWHSKLENWWKEKISSSVQSNQIEFEKIIAKAYADLPMAEQKNQNETFVYVSRLVEQRLMQLFPKIESLDQIKSLFEEKSEFSYGACEDTKSTEGITGICYHNAVVNISDNVLAVLTINVRLFYNEKHEVIKVGSYTVLDGIEPSYLPLNQAKR